MSEYVRDYTVGYIVGRLFSIKYQFIEQAKQVFFRSPSNEEYGKVEKNNHYNNGYQVASELANTCKSVGQAKRIAIQRNAPAKGMPNEQSWWSGFFQAFKDTKRDK